MFKGYRYQNLMKLVSLFILLLSFSVSGRFLNLFENKKPLKSITARNLKASVTSNAGLANQTTQNSDAWNKNILDSHNWFRGRMENTSDLSWNESLVSGSIQYAKYLANRDSGLTHSGGDYGENLFLSNPGSECEKALYVVGYMFAECSLYPWNKPDFYESTGHFTQIVWQGSKSVAAGMAVSSSKKCYVVLRYWPPGNVLTLFADNVQYYKGGNTSVCQPEDDYVTH